ncbi:serine/arginine repetitive matrix protein 1-like [Frankliniella occidentalis]|uniref:Serine/arginine repetitive matrix protein 1-like n=1 Tax=Frankliniella occidentalis TaxID=133901 RepID=A0A9C6XSF1_FRAOC|nr:serine/arginine repetitive matrix protein 1-like [Frankliniella occidentalis]
MTETSGGGRGLGGSLSAGLCHGLGQGLGHACEACAVPPSSPNLPRRKQAQEDKSGSPKAQARPEARPERTPPMPRSRRTLQVHTALLDLPGSDLGEANTTPERQSSTETSPTRQPQAVQQRVSTSPDDPALRSNSERVDMPPELIVTPAHRRKGRGRHGSMRELRDLGQHHQGGDGASPTNTSAALLDCKDSAADTSASPTVVQRRRSLSVLVDVRAGPPLAGAPRPASQHARSLPNARRRQGSARRAQPKRAVTPTPTPVPPEDEGGEGSPSRSPMSGVWLGTPCEQCDPRAPEQCNNYTANVPLAWGPPPQHEQPEQQDVLRSCSQKLSAISALQRPAGAREAAADGSVTVRVTRRRRPKAPVAAAQQPPPATAATPPRKAQASWPQRQNGRPAPQAGNPSRPTSLAALRVQHGAGASASVDDDQDADGSDGGRAHWRRGQLRLRRQKRHEVASAARVVEEAVSVLGAAQRRRAKSKGPPGAVAPQGPQDLEALSRRARFRGGAVLSGVVPNNADVRSDGGVQENGHASDDLAGDSEQGKAGLKKKKKRKLGLPKRVKRVLSATAAISQQPSEKPR